MTDQEALSVFFSYHSRDEDLRDQLETHLALLKRTGQIRTWHDRKITAGGEWAGAIDEHLEAADIILLLVSPPFLASDYCWDVEIKRAVELHEAREARVIPIILRPSDWSDAPFAKLQALPRHARPVTTWPSRDEAFLDVIQGIRAAIEDEAHRRAVLRHPPAGTEGTPRAVDISAIEPVVLRELSLVDLRCFKDFKLKLSTRPREGGQWVLLLGNNGAGKSTLLRGVALAVMGSRRAEALTQFHEGRSLVRHGSTQALVTVKTQSYDSGFFQTSLDFSQASIGGQRLDFPVFAYGCGRGSALGGPERSVEFTSLEAVRTLFSADAHLVHAETWLRQLELRALKSSGGEGESFRDAVHATLVELLPGVERLEVDADDVVLQGEAIGRSSLEALSDGYGSTFGWVLDLIARWSEHERQAERSLDGDFAKEMTGLVLIDELDLHLHPTWQMRVVADLRRTFPLLSFVATTHNPMTLRGARDGEIYLLRKSAEGDVEAQLLDLRPGLRADEILTGAWFGLSSTLDNDTIALLDRYQLLLRQGAGEGDEERRELERELQRRLANFGVTREDRLARELVADLDDDPLSLKERSELQAKMKAMLSA